MEEKVAMRVRTAVMTDTEARLYEEACRNVRIAGARLRETADIPPIGFTGGLVAGLLGFLGWLLTGEKA